MNWKELISHKRLGQEEKHEERREYRTEFQRDYDRLIFSAPFRRLQNKTQVFPLPGSVFVHNRLTHSLEVSSVGRSLGNDCARALIEKHPALEEDHIHSIGAIVSAACLAHDLGNPPFGHSGERAIASYFADGKGKKLQTMNDEHTGTSLSDSQWNDLIHFDGNANTFRMLTHQFQGRRPGGYVMTYSSLASIVKYPFSSDFAGKKAKFGFFESERDDYLRIAKELGLKQVKRQGEAVHYARHPLVYLVEAADDICYEVMDLEDAHKLRLLSDEQTLQLFFAFIDEKHKTLIEETFRSVTDVNEQIVYLRSCVINNLEHECVNAFIRNEEAILDGSFKGSLIDAIREDQKRAYEACAEVAHSRIYRCKEVLDIDLAGYHIIYTLLDLLIDAVLEPQKAYSKLLIAHVSSQYQLEAPTLYGRILAVLDFISGMTDVYALDLYRKINGHSLPMV
ncbi:MAG: dNTP triphosphohydrolase [Bacteroidaceae bacterium]